ncbi:MAG: nucleotidyl transferase AbiEii/AbiGii toxin family protein [Nitrospinae bacterium]|nr:nucleotidyl transferase AbiEii/AbiGii toxin family protein [Nitrospinota bacterium]
MQSLFGVPIAAPLRFKGGASLCKAYRAIGRFAGDLDLTYDIRALAPDLVGGRPCALPTSKSQEHRRRLPPGCMTRPSRSWRRGSMRQGRTTGHGSRTANSSSTMRRGRRLRRDSGQAHGDSLEPPVRAPGLGT